MGQLVFGRCRRTVRAIVRKGLVTALRVEDCKDCKSVRMSPDVRALLRSVQRRLKAGDHRPWRPIPVSEFLKDDDDTVSGTCYLIFIRIFNILFFCCKFEGGFESKCTAVIVVPEPEPEPD